MTDPRRVSLTLDVPDQRAVEAFVDPSRPEHAALEVWASQHGLNLREASEAAVLRMLVRAGAEALRMKALDDGYDQLAAEREASRAERRALRDRAAKRADERLPE